MLRADYLKEKIDWLKTVVSLGTALVVSLVAWIVQNYESTPVLFVGTAAFIGGWVLFIIIYSVQQIHRCLEQLEEP